jgi:hypothetical protein
LCEDPCYLTALLCVSLCCQTSWDIPFLYCAAMRRRTKRTSLGSGSCFLPKRANKRKLRTKALLFSFLPIVLGDLILRLKDDPVCSSNIPSNMRHPDYPIWTFLGFVAVVLPGAWHWRSRNISTLSIIAWLALGNLSLFVNTLVWADNYRDWSPIWCDICMSPNSTS